MTAYLFLITCWTFAAQVARVAANFPWSEKEKIIDGMHWPAIRDRSNKVNVSMFLSDVVDFDEQNGIISVSAAIEMAWNDKRWGAAAVEHVIGICDQTQWKSCPWTEHEAMYEWVLSKASSGLFGNSAESFLESARNLAKDLGASLNVKPWLPVPPQLLLKTGSNPLGKTEYDPVIYCPNSWEGTFYAFWMDTAETYFDVSLSYIQFPFDRQTLELCIPFDYFSDPYLSRQLYGIDDSGENRTRDEVIRDRALRWDEASDLSPWASKRFVNTLERLGFLVVSIEGYEEKDSSYTSSACIRVIVQRKISILLLRFFLPLTMLLFIPFAGFWIPIHLVMPRVATGFISFLSLQVFRTLAYSLIPQTSSSLLWMDVIMFCVTEIMFASVIENVIAQSMRARVSQLSALYIDTLARWTFPTISSGMLGLCFCLGAAGLEPSWIMLVSQILIGCWQGALAVAVFLYVRALPKKIMSVLIDQISHPDHHYREMVVLDRLELATVFRVFDNDGTGAVTAEEAIETFEHFGLAFQTEEQLNHFKADLKHAWNSKGNNSLDLDGFCVHFGQLFRRRSQVPTAEDAPAMTVDHIVDEDAPAMTVDHIVDEASDDTFFL